MSAVHPASAAATQPRPNRLIDSTSPYLLQHAYNPVDWFPWGPEAFEKARQEDKPVFLSIGYSACHWCHVMEHESFENPEIAEVLNEHFVSIKVDREERPDLDEIYMTATLLYNQGQGGWPMSVFLTPDQKPFFAGTYFPPASQYGRPGFRDLLLTINRLWREDRERILESSESLTGALQSLGGLDRSEAGVARELVSRVADALEMAFDDRTGGMSSGGTNKFPPSMAMSLMLREYHRSRAAGTVSASPSATAGPGAPGRASTAAADAGVAAGIPADSGSRQALLEKVELTLDCMASGGIYDQLGGGIHRYSTDPEWLVPHFEKMLYDQALVAGVYLEAFQLTGHPRWLAVGRDILDYVLRDLQSPEGGFYSARDADSEGVEGKFYIWTKAEIMDALGERAGEIFCSYYDVSEAGNWEGVNILHVERGIQAVARLNRLDPAEVLRILQESRQKLFEVRERRVPPGLDDKVLTGWNGLMIASLARGGRITGEQKYTRAAAKAADFILTRMTRNGRLLRAYRKGVAHTGGYLDDYAFFVEGLLELYEATFEPRWLDEAIRLNEAMIRHFWDEREGAFFFTADDAEPLLVRTKDATDQAIPSGNSVALLNLLRLSAILDRDDLREKAEQLMKAVAGSVEQSPFGFNRFLVGVDFYHDPGREVVIVGSPGDPATQALIKAVNQVYDPHRVVLLSDPSAPDAAAWAERIPLLAGKELVDGRPAAYVCQNRTCRRPVTHPGELVRDLQAN